MSLPLHRGDTSRRVSWWSLIGVALVPLLIAGGFLYATWHADERLDTVTAAVVNNDQPVKINGTLVPLGRQLAGGLVTSGDNDPKRNYAWVLSDDDDAAAGLKSGEYAAVVTIPKNFSKAATSYAKDADKAEQATIDVDVSKTSSIVDPALSKAIVSSAVSALNSQLTTTYLQNIYVGFNQLNKQFSTVADAAGKLDDGATGLADGVAKTDRGVGKLSKGLDELSTGGQTLSTSVDTYTDGVGQAADGLDQLAAGTKKLPQQTRQLAKGSQGIADGVKGLSGGVTKLSGGASKLASGADGLADGAKQLNRGMPALATGAKGVATGTAGISSGITRSAAAMRTVVPQQVTCATAGITDPAQCAAFTAGVAAGSQASAEIIDPTRPTAANPGLATPAQQVADGATQLSAGISGTKTQPGLVQGVAGLSSGARQLATGVDGLSDGTAELATGAKKLAKGAQQVATGTDALADGFPALAKGIGSAAKGFDQLATGGSQLATGVRQYTDGVSQTATGVRSLAVGTGKLSDGAQQLATGTGKLADGLAKGADQVPTYTKAERENLSDVVATPVQGPDQAKGGAFSDVSGVAFLFAVVLWIGALVAFLVMGTGVRQAWRSSRPSVLVAARGMAPAAAIGALQAAVLSVAVTALLDLDAGTGLQVFGVGALAAVAFVAVNYALVGLLGGVGRFVSVVVVVLGAAGSLLSAVPEFFVSVRPFLPISPALDAIAASAGGGTGVSGNCATLLAWLVIGAVGSVLAVARHRQLSLARVVEPLRG